MRLLRLFKSDLAKECSEWVSDDIISQKQAEIICDRYGIDYHNLSSQNFGYTILVTLGYLFIGLAVIVLVGANWDEIPRSLRMLGLVGLTTGTNVLAFSFYQKSKNSLSIGLFFLASLFYGTSIMLIAQIYHIDEYYPNGVFWWAVGVLPFALLLKSGLLITLTTVLACIWFWLEISLNFYPVLFPIFLIALGWHIFKVKQSNLLFLCFMTGVGLWFELTTAWFMGSNYRYSLDESHVIYAAGLFISYYGLSKWLISSKSHILNDYGTLLGLWVLRFAVISLLIFSFEWLWKDLLKEQWETPFLSLIIVFIFSGIALAFSYLGNKNIHSTFAFVIIYLAATTTIMLSGNPHHAVLLQIITNLILIGTGIWLIVKGINDGITHYFFLGIATILITGLLRYIDLVGDYIGASILFIVFAAILLGAARYWKSQERHNKHYGS